MTYNKKTWANGDIIRKENMNNIEEGIYEAHSQIEELKNNTSTGGGNIDLTGYAKTEDIPTRVSQLTNDANYVNTTQMNEAIANVTGQTIVEPAELDMPKVFFYGDKPTTKNSVYATIEYKSKTEHFKGYVDIKCQGTSSMAYPKKNYTIKMYTDSTMQTKIKKDFKGWGAQSKFCLKANYIDHSHARNIVSAKLWDEIVASRTNYAELPELLRTSPCNGAIDGFPIKVYYNDTYEGTYTWNIPKDAWMFNMDDTLDNHCVLCGEEYVSGCFRSANAGLWSDEVHDEMPASIATSFNNFISFVMNSTDDEFKTNLENYVYVDSLIDYYIFQYAICGLDSMGKNQLFATYDGTKWIATSYDMDSTFGLYWSGSRFVSTTYRMQEDYESMVVGKEGNLLYVRLEELFVDEIKTRYAELRDNVLSYANIVDKFERFMDTIGLDLYAEDLTIYTGIPSGSTNNIQQIRNYTRDRLTYVDAQIEALTTPVSCTGIVLSADTLSLTTSDTQTLSVVVSPDNCTDTVTWSVNPTGIVTVANGVVTPVASGECTITATCGNYSDSCSVTVEIEEVECTGISLDQDTLTLGIVDATSGLGTNLLDSVSSATSGTYLTFNTITLEPGIYTLKNINGGTFTYLEYTINGVKVAGTATTDNVSFNIIDEGNSIKIGAEAGNDLNNTADKIGLYKTGEITIGASTNLTKEGNGYFTVYGGTTVYDDASNEYAIQELDSTKSYILRSSSNGLSFSGTPVILTDAGSNVITKYSQTITYYHSQYIITGASKLYCSTSTAKGISNIKLYEVETIEGIQILSAQLTATVTPDGCTDAVVWSVDPTGIVTVDSGLVTAVANGSATVTATCGSYSDTCSVTVSGMS